MEIISLDIGGKMAHFRKYYANNTALSYTIPPRTTVMGMLAAILGRERDDYYEELASEKLRVGIRVMTPLKKSFHRLNFLSIKNSDDFSGKGGSIQTPFEIVTGFNLVTDWVTYRLFLSCTAEGNSIFDEIKSVLWERKQVYNLTMGTANFTASVLNTSIFKEVLPIESRDWISINSAVVSDTVTQLNFEKDVTGTTNFLEEELFPADFISNQNREVRKMVRSIYSTRNLPFEVKLKIPFYALSNEIEVQNIVFLE